MSDNILPGQSFPLGATVFPGGVNFSVFTKNCSRVELLLFDAPNDPQPTQVLPFDPEHNRSFYYWHMFVPGIMAGQVYGYRVHGPFDPHEGMRFDGNKVLVDPYARAVTGCDIYDRQAAIDPGDNCAASLRSVVVDPEGYDWEGDQPLRIPMADSVIYELHVRGFTQHPSSGVAPALRGTYLGLIEKIPYLKELGITAVELMPVQQFDPGDAPPGLTNYWGYSQVAFFAPHSGYASAHGPLAAVDEFRDMVKALHRAGIEVILDVVFNHTAEGDHNGPTLSMRGFENVAYYLLESNPARYANYTGCGNTINANHSIVRRLIMDCLRYWVNEMHVDGFRFDLASVLARDEQGQPVQNPPVLWSIESDPVLAGTKIIAEAWDAGGLYQVGSFIGDRFAEWNGVYRDDVRQFVRGDMNTVSRMTQRLAGSPDLYEQPKRDPNRSINFVTSHDGFTLNDLVSYRRKHNKANGENNRDGSDHNFSWNCGVEGPTDDATIDALRLRQIKNFFSILFLSHGAPMMLMGDEVRRTQQGNNNAYCQDNEISWFDWALVEANADLLRFVRHLINFAQSHDTFKRDRFWATHVEADVPNITWHGVRLGEPDYASYSHTLAYTLRDPDSGYCIHVMLNAYEKSLTFDIPPCPYHQDWARLIDTSLPSPQDFVIEEDAPPVHEHKYRVKEHSVVMLHTRAAPSA
jgi:isoamylase